MSSTEALRAELLKLGCPVFAVLDGAQFDDLPRALIDGDFVNRPLYRDRGGQSRAFDLTAPQLVWLDRKASCALRQEDRPCDPHVVDDLFGLLEDTSPAVFWTCTKGGDVLYNHLRKINRVLIPARYKPVGLPHHDDDDEDCAFLFRHADANVMAQVLPALPSDQLVHLLGPTEGVMFAPSIVWSLEASYDFRRRSYSSAPRRSGMLRFDEAVMETIEARRSIGILRHLLITFSSQKARLGSNYRTVIEDAHRRAIGYGIETLEDFELFTKIDCKYGPRFEYRRGHEEALAMLSSSDKSPTERVYYAERACLDALEDAA